MGLPLSRMSDTGFGDDDCHDSKKKDKTGIIIGGAQNVVANGLPVARMSDMVIRKSDGHSGVIISGSSNVVANGLPVARMSETFIGCFTGILIEGASNVSAGG